MSRFAALLDWGTRVALFVLAAVATLAIVGALVAIPGDVARSLAGLEAVRDVRTAEPVEARDPSARRDASDDGGPAFADATGEADTQGGVGVAGTVSGVSPPPSPGERIAGWLEVIAWTLIANAALLALFGAALLRRRL